MVQVENIEAKYPGCRCWECPFKDHDIVPPSGPLDAKLCFIGQAPAYYEVQAGMPFSGPSGSILDGSLEQFGLSREDVRADNSVLCFNRAGEGDPPQAAVEACRGHFDDLKAEVLCLMGNSSLASFMGPSHPSITSVANTLFRHEGRKIIPLIHPAFYLRKTEGDGAGTEAFRDFLDGIDLIRRALEMDELPSEVDVNVKVFDNSKECVEFLNWLRDNPPDTLAVDLETDQPDTVRGTITCVSLAYDYKSAFVIPWNGEYLEDHNSEYLPLLEFNSVYQALKECLEAQPNVVMHNAPFDAVLLRREDIQVKVKDDSLLLHYALDERSGSQGLKRVSRLILGLPDWEAKLKPYLPNKEAPFTLIPPPILFFYAGLDSCNTVRLRDTLRDIIERPENDGPKRLYDDLLTPCNNMLMVNSSEGVGLDAEALVTALREMPDKLNDLEHQMEEMAGDRLFNPRSPKQIAQVLFDKFKLPQISGRSTKASVLQALKDLHDFPDILIEYRQYQKVYGTYMVNLAQSYVNGRGHMDLRLFGTVTGRLSGFVMIIPRESRGDLYKSIKDVFIPDPGYFLWAADYKGAELRVGAVLSGDSWLLEQLADPKVDFHSLMAEQLFGERFLTADPELRHELRVTAKMFVFGLGYGREAPSVAKQLGCSLPEAVDLIAKYFAPMPQYLAWRSEMARQAIEDEVLENPLGRRRRFPLITQDNMYEIRKQAYNTPAQGTSSDMNLMTMERIHTNMRPIVKPMFPIHDSIISNVSLDASLDDMQRLIAILEDTPKELLNTDLPFFLDHKVGMRWGSLGEEGLSLEEIWNVKEDLRQSLIA